MNIKVAFYKGKGDWKNKLIRWWTKSPYSHAELVLPDDITWLSISPLLSSTVAAREKKTANSNSWDFIELGIEKEQYRIILDFFEDTKGQGYDWVGMLLSQFLPCKIKHKRRWYCSEWIAYALRIANVINWRVVRIYDRRDLSPGVLYSIIKEANERQEEQEEIL